MSQTFLLLLGLALTCSLPLIMVAIGVRTGKTIAGATYIAYVPVVISITDIRFEPSLEEDGVPFALLFTCPQAAWAQMKELDKTKTPYRARDLYCHWPIEPTSYAGTFRRKHHITTGR